MSITTIDSTNIGAFPTLTLSSTYNSQYSGDEVLLDGGWGVTTQSTGNVQFTAGSEFLLQASATSFQASNNLRIRSESNNVQVQSNGATITAARWNMDAEYIAQVGRQALSQL